MKRIILLLVTVLCYSVYGQDTISNRLITVDNWNSKISFLVEDTSDYFVNVPLEGMQNGDASSHALFLDPFTYELYGMLDTIYDDGQRSIYKINPLTGETNLVLNLNDYFTSADITPDGRIFAILGNGTMNTSGAIYEIDLVEQTIDSVAMSNVPYGEPRALFYYPPSNELWVICGDLEQVFRVKVDNWNQNDTITIPIGADVELHGTYYENRNLLVSNYSGTIWALKDIITHDSLPVPTYIADMPENVMDLVKIKLIASAEERGLCPNLDTPDTLYAVYPSASYQWYFNGTALEGDTLDRIAFDSEGEYQLLTEINSTGNMIFSEIINVVHATVPNVTIEASATELCPGDEITLTGSAGGTSQWYRNGDPIEGATTNVYIATESGVYNMIKTNQSGCSDSAAVGITITAKDPGECETGVSAESAEELIKIYPTIAEGFVIIELDPHPATNISLYSVTGEQIFNQKYSLQPKINIDLSKYPDGLYIIQIESGRSFKSGKIIKEN